MTLNELLTKHLKLASREVASWSIDGPYRHADGSQTLTVLVRPHADDCCGIVVESTGGDDYDN